MLSAHASPVLVAAVRAIAQWLLLLPAALVLLAVVARRRWRADVLEAIIAGALTIAFAKIGGALYMHARPFIVYGRTPLVAHAPDNAFPSDHLAACGLAFGFLWTRSKGFAAIVAVCAALIGAARVLAGLHWPIDIVAGFVFGVLAIVAARIAINAAAARQRSVR